MTVFEIIISAASMAAGLCSILYVRHLIKVSGRDRPEDPERVQKFIEGAPYKRLDDILDQ